MLRNCGGHVGRPGASASSPRRRRVISVAGVTRGADLGEDTSGKTVYMVDTGIYL